MPKSKKQISLHSNWSWLKATLPLFAAAFVLTGLGAFSMDTLSSIRAFVGGEGIYCKEEKNALQSILQYVKTHDEHDYQDFLRASNVTVGDRNVRLALDKDDPDLAAARASLIAGRNHPADIAGIIRLFHHFRTVSYMRDVIALWVTGDDYIDEIKQQARQIHQNLTGKQPDTALINASLARIEQIHLRFNPLADEFTLKLGDASRKTQSLLLWAMLSIAVLLMAIGSIMSRFILKRQESSDNALRISEERLNLAMRGTSDGLWDWDIGGRSVYFSPRLKLMLEEGNHQFLHAPDHYSRYIHPCDKLLVQTNLKRSLRDNVFDDIDFRIITQSGKVRWVRSRAQSTLGANGKPVRMAGSISDVTERKLAALALVSTNRALQMLSRCNEAVIRAENEHDLLLQICHLAVDMGGYRKAWVGYAQDDGMRSILPMAQAGKPAAISHFPTLSWCAEHAAGQGPAGQAIRNGAAVVFDQSRFPSCFPDGPCAGICLPLRDKHQTFGLLALHSDDSISMSLSETKLLQELADDLAFGIASLRAQDEQRKIQAVVLKIAAAVSARTGTEFFQQLAGNMTQALNADAGFVARLLPGEPLTARTIAGVVDACAIDSFDYLLHDSPCSNLLTSDRFIVEQHLAQSCALPVLAQLAPQAYVGRRLDNSLGQPIGFLFVLFRKPLKDSELISSTLKIFAARAAAEMERQSTDARIQDQASLLDKAQDAIIVRSTDQRIVYWNKSAERLYGWSMEEALGQAAQELLSNHPASYLKASEAVLERGEWHGELHMRRKDGSSVTVESRWSRVLGDDGGVQSILAIDTDITLRKAAEREIVHLAFYDHLTMLPNRRLLIDRLQQALASGGRSGKTGALLFIDLDNFKTINDTLGHDTGDLLLQQVAARLVGSVRAVDTVARLGGDEFIVMLLDLENDKPTDAAIHATAVGEKILAALGQPYQIGALEHHSTSSIGITLFNHVSEPSCEKVAKTSSELLKRADLAMYQSKAAGRNTVRFFDPEMQADISTRARLEADLRLALPRKEFLLHYQPQVDGGNRVTGVEALLRWQHPQQGLISPSAFIALAEETGLILPLGLWVLETACAQLAAWSLKQATRQLHIAVNVSARQFHHPDFVAQVLHILARSGANPCLLKLELTESLMVNDMAATVAKMTALKKHGVGFALDDFGTGYSSLLHLKRLPLDELKIDQSFVKDVLSDPNDAAIAHAIVSLAQNLGLSVIAEGVETEAQRDFLTRHGCRAYQGYLFSEPLQIDKLEAFMQKVTAGAALPGMALV